MGENANGNGPGGGAVTFHRLTPEDRAEGAIKAREARAARAEAGRTLKNGETTVAEVLASDDPALKRWKVSSMLRHIPGIGPARAQRIMSEAGIADNRRIGGMTAGQKQRLAERMASRG